MTRSPAERRGLAPAEQALRVVAAVLFAVSVVALAAYLIVGVTGPGEFPFVANSLAKDVMIAAGAALLVWDVRRFDWMATVLGVAHVVIVFGTAWLAIIGRPLDVTNTVGSAIEGGTLVWLWSPAAAAMALALLVLGRASAIARYDLRYLPPSAFRALAAFAEVLVLEHDREITPAEVAQRADHYLARFAATGKWKLRLGVLALAWYPLLTLRPPLHLMAPDHRRAFLRRRFLDEVAHRAVPGWVRELRQAMIRAGQQLCFLGYYGDARAAARTGYVPFSERPESAAALAAIPRARPRVRSLRGEDVSGDSLRADVVVVGSGAAGGMLAHELASRGREVLVLERGRHVDPSDFTEDEPTQLSDLYADGALTLSRDFRFQTLQGSCVGGSTVVNNAVCFDLPPRVLDHWLDPAGLDAGLDPAELGRAFACVRAFLPVAQASGDWPLNPGAARVEYGIRALDLTGDGWRFKLVDCNIADCPGCGYCNIGCSFGRKLSILDSVLPRAQARFGAEGVRVLPECRAQEIVMRGWRASGVRCRLSDGRRITVVADDVVVSAGALASSVLLQRSRLGKGRAGNGLSFNIASPMTLDFPEELHSERGLQISHYLEPTSGDGFMLETWFNPVVSQSLFMPGWFDDHWRNMRRYAHMTCLGAVVGSESTGRVRAGRFGGLSFDYRPSGDDFRELVSGLRLAGRIGLAAGARRVMPATFRYLEINDERELERLGDLEDGSDLSINSSHPQGGNPISRNALRGVVDPDFRVYGTQNVWCCDASVFPSATTVNPQLTVMALAMIAASRVG